MKGPARIRLMRHLNLHKSLPHTQSPSRVNWPWNKGPEPIRKPTILDYGDSPWESDWVRALWLCLGLCKDFVCRFQSLMPGAQQEGSLYRYLTSWWLTNRPCQFGHRGIRNLRPPSCEADALTTRPPHLVYTHELLSIFMIHKLIRLQKMKEDKWKKTEGSGGWTVVTECWKNYLSQQLPCAVLW